MAVKASCRKSVIDMHRAVPRLISEDGFASRESALRAIAEYEKFFLQASIQGCAPQPSAEIDLIWQRHLLDTRNYFRDCSKWANGYIHRPSEWHVDLTSSTANNSSGSTNVFWCRVGQICESRKFISPSDARELNTGLENEDLSGIMHRVRDSLQCRNNTAKWAADAKQLLDMEPELAINEYKRFLSLLIRGEGPLTPCKLVDEFWHQHILDSKGYFLFCARHAGRYIHHDPSYERPQRFHKSCFRRAKVVYFKHMGFAPSERAWAHIGASEGGGDGSGGGSGFVVPLFIISSANHMRANISVGSVSGRHYKEFHPLLKYLGMPKELWHSLLNEIDSVPLLTWKEFWNKNRTTIRFTVGITLLIPISLIRHAILTKDKNLMPTIFGSMILYVFFAGPTLWTAWQGRGRRMDDAKSILERYTKIFNFYNVTLDLQSQVEIRNSNSQFICYPGEEKKFDRIKKEYASNNNHHYFVVDAKLPLTELKSSLLLEDLSQLVEGAEQVNLSDEAKLQAEAKRKIAETRRKIADARRQKHADRNAYYLARGVEPGPLAWFYSSADWFQATVLGLVIGLVAVFLIVAWILLAR